MFLVFIVVVVLYNLLLSDFNGGGGLFVKVMFLFFLSMMELVSVSFGLVWGVSDVVGYFVFWGVNMMGF